MISSFLDVIGHSWLLPDEVGRVAHPQVTYVTQSHYILWTIHFIQTQFLLFFLFYATCAPNLLLLYKQKYQKILDSVKNVKRICKTCVLLFFLSSYSSIDILVFLHKESLRRAASKVRLLRAHNRFYSTLSILFCSSCKREASGLEKKRRCSTFRRHPWRKDVYIRNYLQSFRVQSFAILFNCQLGEISILYGN